MKKTLPAIILSLALLCACGNAGNVAEPTPEPEQSPPAVTAAPTPELEPEGYRFTREDFPSLDGSTSTAPLAEAMCMELLGVTGEEAAELVSFSKTTRSYFELIYGWADLLIVAEANDEVLALKESNSFEWEKTPFATDAFVFVVNEDNPVSSITVDEARKIYTGEITNWSELGGEDREIIPFQRNEGAGSQTLMEKLVMQGEPMMDAPKAYVVGGMGQLMEAVKGYDGSPGAIGYSVYYYAEEMRMAQGLKIIAVDGVDPTPETIRAGDYPLTNPYYVVISADAPEGSATRELYNWLLSEHGQNLAAREGYVSIMDVDVTAEARPAPKPEIGTRRYEQYTDRLVVSDDYGPLIPYVGLHIGSSTLWGFGSCLYGLMTADGAVVVDPVYSSVRTPSYYDDGGVLQPHPLLVLRQGDPDAPESSSGLIAVAAADGSWCTDFIYRECNSSAEGLVLISDDGMTLMRPDGSIEREIARAELDVSEEVWKNELDILAYGEGLLGRRCGDYVVISFLEQDDGTYYHCYKLSDGSYEDIYKYAFWDMDNRATMTFMEYVQPPIADAIPWADQLLGWDAPYLLELCEENGNGNYLCSYYNSAGTPLPELTCTLQDYGYYPFTFLKGGLVEQLEPNYASYYDLETGECIFRTCLNYDPD